MDSSYKTDGLAKFKFGMGFLLGYSLSVPDAVDLYFGFWLKPLEGLKVYEIYRLGVISEYLFSGDDEPIVYHPDWGLCCGPFMLGSRLEGDLKRYGARLDESNPLDVEINFGLVHSYCESNKILPLENKIWEAIRPKFKDGRDARVET